MKNKKSVFEFNGIKFPMEDSREDLLFEVNKGDVKNSKRGDPNKCVVACAIRRAYGDVFVRRDTAVVLRLVSGIPKAFRYRLSAGAVKAVKEFDSKGLFPVGEYRMKAITPSQTLAAKRLRSKKKITTKTRTVRAHVKYMVRANKIAKFVA